MRSFSALLALCLLVYVHGTRDTEAGWTAWKLKYGKVYSSPAEEHKHREKWEESRQFVESHNNRADRTFSVELNSRADRVEDNDVHYTRRVLTNMHHEEFLRNDIRQPPPDSFDWRTRKGVIGPVSNQGQVGSSEAVEAIAELESLMFLQSQRIGKLSMQELLDCCASQSRLYSNIFECVHNIGGLCSEASYPISKSHHCNNASCTPVFKIGGGKLVPRGREDLLTLAVLQLPIMAGIDASQTSFQMYRSGIYSDNNCSSTKIDHIIQIVGYGREDDQEFWIVKNSWGVEWGMEGYILMSKNKNNMCGIATMAMYPTPEQRQFINVKTGTVEFMQNLD